VTFKQLSLPEELQSQFDRIIQQVHLGNAIVSKQSDFASGSLIDNIAKNFLPAYYYIFHKKA